MTEPTPPEVEVPAKAATDPVAWPPHLRLVGGVAHAAPRRQPENVEAEEAVVGAILFAGEKALKKVREVLRYPAPDPKLPPFSFFGEPRETLYQTFLEMGDKGKVIDLITVPQHMRERGTVGHLKAHGGDAHLADLCLKIAQIDNVEHHARLVVEHAVARYLLHVAADLQKRAYDAGEIGKVISSAHERLAQLLDTSRGRAPLKLFDREAFLTESLAALARPIPPKLPFGFGVIDEHLAGGFPAGGVVALCAPPKHMKTAFLVELLTRWARAGERIIYITGENTAQEIFARLCSHEQFGATNKWHTTIKHEGQEKAEENRRYIEWMAGRVRVISLPDEETKEPRGLTWTDVVEEAERESPAPMLVIDYVEEFADRLPRGDGRTEQQSNKEVMRTLKNYACRRQARVLAVCSVSRGQYAGDEAVFNDPEARPEDFAGVAKHSGYIDYAAAAILALQFPSDRSAIDDPETRFPCVPMRLHLAFVREGLGPVTANILAFGGFCRFVEDMRDPSEIGYRAPPAAEGGLKGIILRELDKEEHASGQTGPTIARLLGKRMMDVKNALKEMVEEGQIASFARGRAIIFRHPRHEPPALNLGGSRGGEPN